MSLERSICFAMGFGSKEKYRLNLKWDSVANRPWEADKRKRKGRTDEERNSSGVSQFCSRRDLGRTKLNPSIYARNFYHHG